MTVTVTQFFFINENFEWQTWNRAVFLPREEPRALRTFSCRQPICHQTTKTDYLRPLEGLR